MSLVTKKETTIMEDADGNVTSTSVETSTNIQRNEEPDYIKLYTKMWCEFNGIPLPFRELFMQLVIRMTYCNADSLENSQLVNTGKPWSDSIMATLHWKKAMYQRGIKALCDCKAIKKIARGVYQINPQYAGKGEWKYNPKLKRGGIEDLVAEFNFKNGTVKTTMVWADDGEDTEFNKMYRDGLGVSKKSSAVLKTTRGKKNKGEVVNV